ncbi:MAG: transposase [Gemmataceae bacterium]
MRERRPMYRWRKMTDEERQEVLAERQRQIRAWHGPPHYRSASDHYMITAACFDHRPIIGESWERLAEFERLMLDAVRSHSQHIFAWNVLPNHYHLIIQSATVFQLLQEIGRTHGRTSYRWNREDNCRGRQVWHRAAETGIKSERHFWAAFNYVLHNAVKHGYVEQWQDWPFSNAVEYLNQVGREIAEERWREFPLLDFGKDWDPPEL